MYILVINAGSSSLKYQLFEMESRSVLAKGLCERIGIDGKLTHKVPGKDDYQVEIAMPTHSEAIASVIDALTSKDHGVVSSLSEISAVGHRVLHGGMKFSESVIINEKVKEAIVECIPLGPLHNPANLMGIDACEKVMPGVPQVAVFDTAFHQSMPEKSYMYALPYEYYEKYGVRKYGFHGTSHRYVAARTAEFLGKKPEELNIITCHLGNGSSIAAVKGGKCYDTTMGFTPLDGLIMGTRSGSIDPAIIGFISEKTGMNASDIVTMLNKKSGFLGMTGLSSDLRDVYAAAEAGDKKAILAKEMLDYQVTKYIGSYAAAMGGVDAVVFTAGIGENTWQLRENVSNALKFMGMGVDHEKNQCRGVERDISAEGATVKTLIIPTNEELMIAMDTEALVK